jgi:hypothetical protein
MRSSIAAVAAYIALAAGGTAHAQSVCPAVGADTNCGTIITITDAHTSVTSTGQGPYDSIEDTLIGVVNNSAQPIQIIHLKSSSPIFAFDGDGIDTYGIPGNFLDSTGYGGPNAYFTDIDLTSSEGNVHFITPIAPHGGTAYFSLEEAVSNAISCRDVVNNAVPKPPGGGTQMTATFTPNLGLTMSQAAFYCGFKDIDWQQWVTVLPAPSPFAQIGHASTKLTAPPQFLDPVQGGYTKCTNSGTCTDFPDNSYPFYLDPNSGELASMKTTSSLRFADTPSDPCLPGGTGQGCGGRTAPAGSFVAFTTHLAGVNFDGTATDLGVGFTWKSDYNGTSGGAATTKNLLPADPGSGTGGVTVTGYQPTTDYEYNGITVTAVNGQPVNTNHPPDCTGATPSTAALWPPNHQMAAVSIIGVTDADGDSLAIVVTSLAQDEPSNASGDGNACPDGSGVGSAAASVRVERAGAGDGRVYHVGFTADDGKGGSCTGIVTVCVPHNRGDLCGDDGATFDSTTCN